MSIATQEAIKRCFERMAKEKISARKAAMEEGVSLNTIYRALLAKRQAKAGKK